MRFSVFVCLFIFLSAHVAIGAPVKSTFFVFTKKNEVNLRKGPGEEYKIIAKLLHTGIPLLVIYAVDNWYLVKDLDQEEGWVRQNLVSTKNKTLIVKENNVTLCWAPVDNPNDCISLATISKNAIVRNLSCSSNWCRVMVRKGLTGWIPRIYLWGEKGDVASRL